jgi:hypothetical protein
MLASGFLCGCSRRDTHARDAGWHVAHGTAIIAVQTDDAIVIGADSRQVHGRFGLGQGYIRIGSDDNACKVIEHNGSVFALAGPAQLPPDGAEAVPIALSVMTPRRTTEEMARELTARLLPPFAKDPQLLTGREGDGADGKLVLGFLFGRIEHARPVVRATYFMFHARGPERLTAIDIDLPGHSRPAPRVLLLGRALSLESRERIEPSGGTDHEWGVDAIRDMMRVVAQRADNSTFVGGDIDFAIITRKGIERRVKPACRSADSNAAMSQ